MRVMLSGLVLLVLASAVRAQVTHYVRDAGELTAALDRVQPGDTVIMANGTWRDVAISFEAKGAPGDTITLRAETPGQVILTGTSHLEMAGEYLKVEGLRFENGALPEGTPVIAFRTSSSSLAYHSRLTQTAIINYNPPDKWTEYKWVSLYGRFNRVDHCYFAGKTNEGALLVVWLRDPPYDAPPEHRIDHNHFGYRPELGANGAETIRIGTSARSMQNARVVVEYNLFTDTNGELEIISNKSCENIYRYNTFRRARGTLTLRHGNRCTVEGNFFLGEHVPGTGGVRIIGEDHRVINNYFQDLTGTGYYAALSMVQGVPDSPLNRYFQVKRPVVAHNTFVNVERSFIIGIGRSSDQSLPPEDVTIVNNVVQTYPDVPVVDVEMEPVGTTVWAGNIFYGKPGTFPQEGVTSAYPDLVYDGSTFYRPSEQSPVIDAALPEYAPDADIEVQPRDARPDAGADEVSNAPVHNEPLHPGDVGPSWLRLTPTLLAETTPLIPSWGLGPNYPNPFDSTTALPFFLDTPGIVQIRVYDLTGRETLSLPKKWFPRGAHEITLHGHTLASGMYLVVLETERGRDYRFITVQHGHR